MAIWDLENPFRYSKEEYRAIIEALPDPDKSHYFGWETAFAEIPINYEANSVAEYKELWVINELEEVANRFLYSKLDGGQLLKKRLRKVDNIVKLAKKLRTELNSKEFELQEVLDHLLMIPDLSYHSGGIDPTLPKELDALIKHADLVKKNLRILAQGGDDYRGDVALQAYLEDIFMYWENWTGRPVGKSKSGGLTARFLMEVYNPMERFAEMKLRLLLRPKAKKPDLNDEPLNEARAAGLIRYYVKKSEA